MTTQDSHFAARPQVDMGEREQPHLLIFLACLGLLGCVSLFAGAIVAAFYVPDYDWVADTISDLGAGEHQRIMDWTLYGFAAGIMATALGAAHAHLGKLAWSTGIVSLAIIAGLVIVIAARDEYGDGDTGGLVIHSYVVMAYGLAMAVAAFAAAPGAAAARGWFRPALIGLGLLWCLASPYFFFMGTSWDGLYERGLGVIAAAITVILDRVLIADPEA